MKRFPAFFLLLTGLAAVMTACGPTGKEWKPDTEKKVFGTSYRQLAPEPVYNRLRWVHLPDTMPPQELESSGAPYSPVVHLDLKGATLQEAADSLASLARYHSYCASSISGRKISISALGTIDELAAQVAAQEKVAVTVDHETREVRFLAREVAPAFANIEVSGHESKQAD